MQGEKARESRLRRMAKRQGLAISKSRRRDARLYDYGTWMIYDPQRNTLVAGLAWANGYGLTLDEVEEYLTGG